MRIIPISQQECSELLQRVSLGRLACSMNDQPYVLPVAFSYEPDCIYIFSTFGKKIEWMRKNPKVCLQADEIGNRSNWTSVVVTGTYLELNVPQYHTAQREHARERLAAQCSEWWRICRRHAIESWFLRWRLCFFASTSRRSADFVRSRKPRSSFISEP
jgi:nitroimidazol reductase NimA-like FMN-containing flavoprotein (pyridoxamine 5'-phosphate oxidase superfamily)